MNVRVMKIELIRKALVDAYNLLRQEEESVCQGWLSEEYEKVLNSIMCAMDEIDNIENEK